MHLSTYRKAPRCFRPPATVQLAGKRDRSAREHVWCPKEPRSPREIHSIGCTICSETERPGSSLHAGACRPPISTVASFGRTPESPDRRREIQMDMCRRGLIALALVCATAVLVSAQQPAPVDEQALRKE